MNNLSKFKEERRILRGALTKCTQKLNEGEAVNDSVIHDKFNRIESLDSKIKDLLFDGKEDELVLEKELIDQEHYREMYLDTLAKISTKPSQTPVEQKFVESKSVRLPKMELPKFDGNPKGWLPFYTHFSKINGDETIATEDKYYYLMSSLVTDSRPRKLVERFPNTKEGYTSAFALLQQRYGKPEVLTELYIRELLNLVLNKSNSNILFLYEKIEGYLQALSALGIGRESYAAILFPLVESCLNKDLLMIWHRQRNFHLRENKKIKQSQNKDSDNDSDDNVSVISSVPDRFSDTLEQLMEFLRREAEGEERMRMASNFTKERNPDKEKVKFAHNRSAIDLSHTGKNEIVKRSCVFCGKINHNPQDCITGQNISYSQRLKILNDKKCCLICLRPGHFARSCKYFVKCIICSEKHYPILCKNIQKKEEKSLELFSNNSPTQVFLRTLLVNLHGKRVRVLLDSASQKTYIRKELIEQLNLKSTGTLGLVHCLFGGIESKEKVHKVFEIDLRNITNPSKLIRVTALDQTTLCSHVPKLKSVECLKEIREKGVNVLDSEDEISIIIGADFIGKILTGTVVHLKCGLVLLETMLGWTVMGAVNKERKGQKVLNMFNGNRFWDLEGSIVFNNDSEKDSVLNLNNFTLTKALWELEGMGIEEDITVGQKSKMNNAVVNHFKETVTRINGRYQVELPWNEKRDELETNFFIAKNRLEAITKRVNKLNLFKHYNEIFQVWEQSKIIEEVPLKEEEGHFLSHHPVIRMDKISSKIRPVFHASLKGVNNISLNDCLPAGPNLVQLIPTMITKFRQKRIGLINDIKKAFLQILIKETDKTFLNFFGGVTIIIQL